MVRKLLVMLLVVLSLMIGSLTAQDDSDDDTDTTDPSSTVTIFVVVCETQAVVNLNGVMQPGFDLYFQVFSGPQGTGNALTGLRRVTVDGNYAFSEVATYNEGGTVAAGATGSVYVSISREGNPDNSAYNEFVDDIQDGCADPQNPLGVSDPSDGSVVTGDGDTGGTTSSPGTNASGTSTILSPFGGVLNPNYVPPPDDDQVIIGPRDVFTEPRHETPGLIFAECNDYPVAVPGLVYDNDEVVVFWSWFARTPEQVQDHIDNANYSVTYYQTLPLPNVIRSEIQQRGSLFYVFYYSRLGNLSPGQYYIQFQLDWDQPISDGFQEFGPGTDNDFFSSGCGFRVRPNPEGESVSPNPWPFQNLGG